MIDGPDQMQAQDGSSISAEPKGPPRVVIRTDGSARLGGGHVLRTTALAASLQSHGWICTFAVNPATLDAFPHLAQQYDCFRLDCAADDEPRRLRECRHGSAALLIVDHPARDLVFESTCRPWASQVLSIDGTLRRHDCDLLIDPLPDREPRHHENLAPRNCILLLGPQYAPLRSSFVAYREASLARRAQPRPVAQISVVCGATDATNQVVALLSALDDSCLPANARVVVLAGRHRREAATEFASCSRLSVDVRDWMPDPAGVFAESDLALICSGSVCWELCALGVPSIVVAAAANQRLVADSLERHGAAIVASRRDGVEHNHVVAAINRLTGDAALCREMSRSAARLCDGRGADRVARIVSERLSVHAG
jgi:UDP-2,4-diacetamido-2,4,6-trideoxy-beta-L-altropyranose hydrolase